MVYNFEQAKITAENYLHQSHHHRSLKRTLFAMAIKCSIMGQESFKKIEEERDADFAPPAIMCMSFSIEFLLKFFIIYYETSDFKAFNRKKR